MKNQNNLNNTNKSNDSSNPNNPKAKLDHKKMEYLSGLARLKLSSEEIDEYAGHMNMILSYFEQIQSINTDHIEPLISPVEQDFSWREDVAHPLDKTEEYLSLAPERMGNLYKVPPVV